MSNWQFQKIILEINAVFLKTLQLIIKKVIEKYSRVPIQWEDVYYEFLFTIPKIVFNYNDEMGITFKTYLGLQCKFYARTYVKHFVTNRYRILNDSYSYDQTFSNQTLKDHSFDNESSTSWVIDTSCFTFQEFLIYSKRYLENKKIKQIEHETHWNYYKINNLSKKVKSKIKKQFTDSDNLTTK